LKFALIGALLLIVSAAIYTFDRFMNARMKLEQISIVAHGGGGLAIEDYLPPAANLFTYGLLILGLFLIGYGLYQEKQQR